MDSVVSEISAYVHEKTIESELAYQTARWCLMDSLGCGLLAFEASRVRQDVGALGTGSHPEKWLPSPGSSGRIGPGEGSIRLRNAGSLARL